MTEKSSKLFSLTTNPSWIGVNNSLRESMSLRRLTSNYTMNFKPPWLRLSLSKQTWAQVRVRWMIRSGKRGKSSLVLFGKRTNEFQSSLIRCGRTGRRTWPQEPVPARIHTPILRVPYSVHPLSRCGVGTRVLNGWQSERRFLEVFGSALRFVGSVPSISEEFSVGGPSASPETIRGVPSRLVQMPARL